MNDSSLIQKNYFPPFRKHNKKWDEIPSTCLDECSSINAQKFKITLNMHPLHIDAHWLQHIPYTIYNTIYKIHCSNAPRLDQLHLPNPHHPSSKWTSSWEEHFQIHKNTGNTQQVKGQEKQLTFQVWDNSSEEGKRGKNKFIFGSRECEEMLGETK